MVAQIPAASIGLCRVAPGLDQDMFVQLVGQFDDSSLPDPMDLSIRVHIDDPRLLEHIERVGRMLYERRGR